MDSSILAELIDTYVCPRCGGTESAETADDWPTVLVSESPVLMDLVCRECVTADDLSHPMLADLLPASIRFEARCRFGAE